MFAVLRGAFRPPGHHTFTSVGSSKSAAPGKPYLLALPALTSCLSFPSHNLISMLLASPCHDIHIYLLF